MIEMRRTQLSSGDGLIAEEVSDLREGWMDHADTVLADEDIVAAVYEALAKRHPKSRCCGRRGAPADMVLRLLILKLSLSQMSSGWRGTTNRVMLSPDVGRLEIAVVTSDRVLPIARVT